MLGLRSDDDTGQIPVAVACGPPGERTSRALLEGTGKPARDEATGVPGERVDALAREQSFDEFYRASFRSLALQLYAYLGDLGDAQDVVQEAFCRAYQRWDRLVEFDDPAGWVRRVAWNLATSRWRARRAALAFLRRQREQHVEGPGPDRVVLTQALARLPENQRRAVVLHHLGRLSVMEIAQQEGVPEGTVKSWLYRGRAALAAELSVREGGRHA